MSNKRSELSWCLQYSVFLYDLREHAVWTDVFQQTNLAWRAIPCITKGPGLTNTWLHVHHARYAKIHIRATQCKFHKRRGLVWLVIWPSQATHNKVEEADLFSADWAPSKQVGLAHQRGWDEIFHSIWLYAITWHAHQVLIVGRSVGGRISRQPWAYCTASPSLSNEIAQCSKDNMCSSTTFLS